MTQGTGNREQGTEGLFGTNGLRLILASSSPRRQELVRLLGLPYSVIPSRYEEPPAPDTPVSLPNFVTQLALGKAREVAERHADDVARGAVVLGADTLVAPGDDEIGVPLGKPRDTDDACRMLRRLSGTVHRVYTGIALIWKAEEKGEGKKEKGDAPDSIENQRSEIENHPTFAFFLYPACTRVRFRELSDQMIADYVATGEPMDKAGAYGAQGYAAPFIEGYEGDFFNVVGLPLCEVGRALEQIDPAWWQTRRVSAPE